MKIVVGLGNPGRQYVGTPHNAGFGVVDALSRVLNCPLRGSLRLKAHAGRTVADGMPVLLMKPNTFMNRSGESVALALRKQGAGPEDLVVVVDDADLPVGRLRVRAGGSSGGHRGLVSIAECLGTEGFARVRVGVGRGEGGRDLVEHVLGRLPPEDQTRLEAGIERAAEAVQCCLREGVNAAMNAFNGTTAGAA